MRTLLLRWFILTVSVMVAAYIVPGFHVTSVGVGLLAAVVLSLLNAFVRPVLTLLTLPITIVTLGLFCLVLNAAMVGLTAYLLKGVSVAGFGSALLASLVISVTATLTGWLIRSDD